MVDRDRVTVGLTSANQDVLSSVMEKGWFSDAQDVARLGLAVAVQMNVPEGVTSDTDTRWAAGNFDTTGEIRALLAAVYPECKTPVRLMEHLVNEGLALIGERFTDPTVAPDKLLQW